MFNRNNLPSYFKIKALSRNINFIIKHRTKIAILSTSTSDYLALNLTFYLASLGIEADFFDVDDNQIDYYLLNPKSEYFTFKPDFTIILEDFFHISKSGDYSNERLEGEISIRNSYIKSIKDGTDSSLLYCLLSQPPFESYGHFSKSSITNLSNFIYRFNKEIVDRCSRPGEGHVIFDTNKILSFVGVRNFYDLTKYYSSKVLYSFDSIPLFSFELAKLIASTKGITKKCLVLDLDNTCWGGVIGDDGIEGIKLGYGDGVSEAFMHFQKYCLELKKRGVVLAICSKNNFETAKEVFDKHPSCPLKWSDISSFRINWENKADNIRSIANELNIGLDSLVFVDDNPAECEIVKSNLPDVSVVLLPENPSDFISALEDHLFFEISTLSDEDLNRSKFYEQKKKFSEQLTNVVDMDEFLRSLEMKAEISPFTKDSISRVAQLINKSNQFNVTTQRHGEASISHFMNDASYYTQTTRLRDKFGDNGIISVLIGRSEDSTMTIDTLLMSCRVLNRNVEFLFFSKLVEYCIENKIGKIIGNFIPTKKNKIVEDLYSRLGGDLIFHSETQRQWSFDVNTWKSPTIFHIGVD